MLTLPITSKHLIISASGLITRVAVAPKQYDDAYSFPCSSVFSVGQSKHSWCAQQYITSQFTPLHCYTRFITVPSFFAGSPLLSLPLSIWSPPPLLYARSRSPALTPWPYYYYVHYKLSNLRSTGVAVFFHLRFPSACSWLYYRYYDVPGLPMLYRVIACIITNNEQWSLTITLPLLFIRHVRSFDGRLLFFFEIAWIRAFLDRDLRWLACSITSVECAPTESFPDTRRFSPLQNVHIFLFASIRFVDRLSSYTYLPVFAHGSLLRLLFSFLFVFDSALGRSGI